MLTYQLIAEAKVFFENSLINRSQAKQSASGMSRTGFSLQAKNPQWNKAFTRTISIGKIVKITLRYDSTLTIIYNDTKWRLNDITGAFVYKNKKDVMKIEVVIRIPATIITDHLFI